MFLYEDAQLVRVCQVRKEAVVKDNLAHGEDGRRLGAEEAELRRTYAPAINETSALMAGRGRRPTPSAKAAEESVEAKAEEESPTSSPEASLLVLNLCMRRLWRLLWQSSGATRTRAAQFLVGQTLTLEAVAIVLALALALAFACR